MKFRKKQFGGFRQVCTTSPAIGVTGGFTLDQSVVQYPKGELIPEASLAEYDEDHRKVVVLKASRVASIDAQDAKKIFLESDEFITPIFTVNDHVAKKAGDAFSSAPKIIKITNDRNGFLMELSAEISGLSVGDALFQVIEKDSKAAYPVTAPQGLTIAAEPLGTKVGLDETSVDVTTDSKGGHFYLRRIPPIPSEFIEVNHLKTNPNIQFTNSH